MTKKKCPRCNSTKVETKFNSTYLFCKKCGFKHDPDAQAKISNNWGIPK